MSAEEDALYALPRDVWWLRLLVVSLDVLLRWIGPGSFIVLGLQALLVLSRRSLSLPVPLERSLEHIRLPTWLVGYAVLEAGFLLWYLRRKRRLLSDEQPLYAPTDAERERLFARVLESFSTTEEARSFIRGWFHTRSKRRWQGHSRHVELDELLRDNLATLLANAFFNTTLEDVRTHPEHSAVLERFERIVEEKIQHTFPPGYNDEIDCIRQMIEEIPVEHRPLLFYCATLSAAYAVSMILRLVGFRREKLIAPLVDPSRSGRKRREAQAFEYYVHPGRNVAHTADARLPIVICAGLAGVTGIFHVACYLMWRTKRPIFVVGQPAVSLRLKEVGTRPRTASDIYYSDDGFGNETLWEPIGERHKQVRASIPSLDLQTRGLRLMVDRYGYTGACFVSHSLGTALMSFAARQDPPLVKLSILIDPITFLIWHSRLVKIFLYKRPEAVGEQFIRLFSREVGIVSVISRGFFWHQVASFIKPHDSTLPYRNDTVDPRKTIVVLSSEDALVPARQIADRLHKGGIRHLMLEGEHHAGFLMSRGAFLTVMNLIVDEADKADKRTSPILLSRPSFARGNSSTGSLVSRRSRSGSLLSPSLATATSYESAAMTRRTSSTGSTNMLSMQSSGVRKRGNSVLGGTLVMSPSTSMH